MIKSGPVARSTAMVCALRCIRSLTLLILLGFALLAPAQAGPGGRLAGKELLSERAELRRRAAALRGRARHHRLALRREGRPVLELQPADPRLRTGAADRVPPLGEGNHSAPLLQRGRDWSATGASTGSITGSARTPASSARPGASNGAWSASTATGPITRVARWRGPEAAAGRPRSRFVSFCS